jgi:hypothetical protein
MCISDICNLLFHRIVLLFVPFLVIFTATVEVVLNTLVYSVSGSGSLCNFYNHV